MGCPELGSLLTMPTLGDLQVDYHIYGSAYKDEEAEPGYYTNTLTAYGIKTEVTATPHTSIERYTFPGGQGNILLNLGEGLTNETGAWMRKISDTEIEGDDIGYWFCFSTEEGEQIEVQMGVSFVSCENAWENLKAEQKGFDFDAVRTAASDKWDADLSRIRVEGGSQTQKEVFYTALYHALIHPNILNDVNGEYPLMENGGIGKVEEGHNRYGALHD